MRLTILLCAIAMTSSSFADEGKLHPRPKSVCFRLYGGLDMDGESKRGAVCKNELDGLMRKPINVVLEWPNYKKAEVRIDTCSGYLTSIGYGKYTLSRSDLTREAPYLRTCGLLVALHSAKRGRSVFRSPQQALNIRFLPPTIAFAVARQDDGERLVAYESADVSARELISKGEEVWDGNMSIRLIAVADIDGDGINDYVVERSWGCHDNCSDSLYQIGYLSPKAGRKVMRWVEFDDSSIMLPNSTPQTDGRPQPSLVEPSATPAAGRER